MRSAPDARALVRESRLADRTAVVRATYAMMPRMSGFDVCNQVKRELAMDDVFVIILTAKGQEYDRQRGAEVGADLYMTKPFDPDELLARAREVLGS